MNITQVLSSANCIIKYGQKEIGAIQNIKISSVNNVNRITNIFGTYNQKFVRGTLEYNITAERAFIDMSSFYGGVNDLLSIRNDISTVAQNISDLQGKQLQLSDIPKVAETFKIVGGTARNLYTTAEKKLRDRMGLTPDIKETKEAEDILSGKETPDDLIGNKSFDIEISSPIESGIFGSSENKLWTLKDCKIVGRDVKIDINNIILIEGMVLFAKKLHEDYMKEVNSSYF